MSDIQEICRLCGDAPVAWFRTPPFADMEAVRATSTDPDEEPFALCEECFGKTTPQADRQSWQKAE